ncbi:MAG TPA: A24 family peptidase, partial [Rhizomicrobium sp.]
MPVFWILLVVAPFIGSFLGVLALRLPERRPVALSRSVCDRCGHVLAPRDLVPIASYLALHGRCRYCRAPIGWFALFIELAAMLVVVWAGFETTGWVLAAGCMFGWALLLLAIIDWRVQILPDVVTLPLLAAGLAVSYALARDTWLDHLIGAIAGFAVLALVAIAYRRLRKREGLGLGDAKLLAALGAWVAWPGLPSVLLWGSVLGLLFALVRSAAGRRLAWSDRIPFGTFLAAGGWIVWLYG